MVELVEFFVEEIGEKIDTIRTASLQNDFDTLQTVAHQLKGAAAGYGFAPISSTAAVLEAHLKEDRPAEPSDELKRQVDELIGLCRRVSM
ncbi:MAG: Hpt domain-containing protein [Phycisphaeraceae bacterium]